MDNDSLLDLVMQSNFVARDPDSIAKSSASINPLTLEW